MKQATTQTGDADGTEQAKQKGFRLHHFRWFGTPFLIEESRLS